MRYRKIGLLVSAALLTPAAKPAPGPALVHSGAWDVHYNENACILARPFGTGDQETLVAFQPLFNASIGELIVVTRDRRVGTATISEQPNGLVEKVSYFSNHVPHEDKRVTRITVPRTVWDGLDNAETLSIVAPPVSVSVKLVRFHAAKTVFATCERDLLKGWGVDPAALEEDHAPVPMRNPAWFFDSGDYPREAIAAGHVGRVVAILNVDAGGLVTACRIGTSSWPDLNDATCRQARRVRFTPGHDAAGHPAAAIYLLPVRWTMPGA